MLDISTLLLCIQIFIARILDVSLGTVRVMLISKEKSKFAFFVAFVEVFIWFIVARSALSENANLILGIAYALGYATGTFIGIKITNKFVKGTVSVQIITSKNNDKLINQLRSDGYAVSVGDVRGKNEEEKYMLFMEINKRNLGYVNSVIKKMDKNAFIVVNDTKFVLNGYIK